MNRHRRFSTYLLVRAFVWLFAASSMGCNLANNTIQGSIGAGSDSDDSATARHLSVETSPDGSGSKVESLTLADVSPAVDIYSVLRDKSDEFVENTKVTWAMTGAMGTLTVLAGGRQAQFTPTTPGAGQIEVTTGDSTLTINVTVLSNTAPTLSLSEPAGNNDVIELNGSFNIQWAASDPEDDATLSLYYSNSNTGSCGLGTLLASGLSEDSISNYNWDTTGIGVGNYYICARIADDYQSAEVWSDAPLQITSECLWNGSVSTDFHTAANWSSCLPGVPDSTSEIIVPSGPSQQPVISSSVTVLKVASGFGGGQITINSGTTLTFTDDVDTFSSDVSFIGNPTTCTDCQITLPNNSDVANGATLTLGKGIYFVPNGNSPQVNIGNGTSAGHLRLEGGSLESEKPRIDAANTTWGFSGFNIEGTASESSSVYVDGAIIELYSGFSARPSGLELGDYVQIKKMDNLTFTGNPSNNDGDYQSNAQAIHFTSCGNTTIDDLSWDNVAFKAFFNNTNSRGTNVNISACSGIGPIVMNNATGIGYGSYAEKDTNSVLNWQNETAMDCVWTGAVSSDWRDSGNWSNCSNGRNGYPDQFDTARIPATGTSPTLTEGHIIRKFASGTGGGTLTIDTKGYLFLLDRYIESDLTLRGGTDDCSNCELRGTFLEINNAAHLSLYRGINLSVHSGNNVFVGRPARGAGHLTVDPGTTTASNWPLVHAHYYYFSGIIVEGLDSSNRSSVSLNGARFDSGYHTAHSYLHFKSYSQIDGLDQIRFDTVFNWDWSGRHIYVEDCGVTTINDTSWSELDFVDAINGYNIDMANCSTLANDSITVTKSTSGSNLGYDETKMNDPDNVIDWVP